MKILVTGGAGFIGRHLVAEIGRRGRHEIVVFDNLHRALAPADSGDDARFVEGDIRDAAAVAGAVRGAQVVFHLAAQSNVMGAVTDADYAFSTNVTGTYNLLQAAQKAGVKRVVFTSSREVYGDPKKIPVRESAPLRPKNTYGASKVAGEVYCALAAHEGLDTVVLRVANVYGKGDRDRVIPLFWEESSSGRPLTVFGAQKTLDFVWIATVVDALVKAAFGPRIRGAVNVGSGKGITVADLAHRIVQLIGSSSEVRITEGRREEVGRFVADIARAKRLLGVTEPDDPLWALPQLLAD